MPTSPASPASPTGPVVVGYDGSDSAREAVRHAAMLAQGLGVELRVVWVVDAAAHESYLQVWPQDDLAEAAHDRGDQLMQHAHGHLLELTTPLGDAGCNVHPVVVQGSSPANMLVAEAKQTDATMIVVGNRNTHGLRRLLGSVASDVMHTAPCGVYVAKTT